MQVLCSPLKHVCRDLAEEFGVHYHPHHIGRLMHRFHWSHQKPERRAIEQDEPDVERWKRQEWPRIKKKPLGWAPT